MTDAEFLAKWQPEATRPVPEGMLQVSVWLPGFGESCRSTGHQDPERAFCETQGEV